KRAKSQRQASPLGYSGFKRAALIGGGIVAGRRLIARFLQSFLRRGTTGTAKAIKTKTIAISASLRVRKPFTRKHLSRRPGERRWSVPRTSTQITATPDHFL